MWWTQIPISANDLAIIIYFFVNLLLNHEQVFIYDRTITQNTKSTQKKNICTNTINFPIINSYTQLKYTKTYPISTTHTKLIFIIWPKIVFNFVYNACMSLIQSFICVVRWFCYLPVITIMNYYPQPQGRLLVKINITKSDLP